MTALTEKVAREHGTYSGTACWCGHFPPEDMPMIADRTRHLIEVTEQAVRASVAAEIDSVGHHWSGAPALAFFALAADIREGK